MTKFSARVPGDTQSQSSLDLYAPVKRGRRFLEDFRAKAQQYKRSIRWNGTYWQASWEFSGDGYVAEYGMEWFTTRLGCHLEEHIGSNTLWEGMVDEVDLTIGGSTMRKSLFDVRNAVRAIITDENGDTTEIPTWLENAASIADYGRREEILFLDQVTEEEATKRIEQYLANYGQPRATGLAINPDAEDKCVVRASGYVFTANNRYITVGDGTELDASTYLQNLISTDCEFLTIGSFVENPATVITGQEVPTRVWDEIKRVLQVRPLPTDPNFPDPPHVIQVRPGRIVDYSVMDVRPRYYWVERSLSADLAGAIAINPWLVEPGIVRATAWGPISAPLGSFLQQGNDLIVDEVTMGDGMEQASYSASEYDDAQFEVLMQQAEAGGGSGHGGSPKVPKEPREKPA